MPRAVICRELGTIAIEEIAAVVPAPGQVALAVKAACVNFPDILMIAGGYQYKPPLPFTPGIEAAGVITALGEGVTGRAVGDRVVAGMRTGAWAEEIALPADALNPWPENLDAATAAGLSGTYLTAYVAFRRRDNLGPGDTVLIHGAAGGVGLAAVDLARLFGARVIASASTAEKREFLTAYGAHHVVSPAPGFRDEVLHLTDGRGADVVFDPVGGDVFDESLRCAAWGGRILVVGFAGGRIAQVKTNIPLLKGLSIVGVRAGEYGRRDPLRGAENLRILFDLAAQGRLKPHVSHRFPLARAADAMAVLTRRRAIGKVALEMGA